MAVAFVSATLLGFISHAPGSLGIFDAMMLIALTQFEKEELLASLLIFRLLYFVVPFAVAVLTLGIRELSLARRARLCPGPARRMRRPPAEQASRRHHRCCTCAPEPTDDARRKSAINGRRIGPWLR